MLTVNHMRYAFLLMHVHVEIKINAMFLFREHDNFYKTALVMSKKVEFRCRKQNLICRNFV